MERKSFSGCVAVTTSCRFYWGLIGQWCFTELAPSQGTALSSVRFPQEFPLFAIISDFATAPWLIKTVCLFTFIEIAGSMYLYVVQNDRNYESGYAGGCCAPAAPLIVAHQSASCWLT